MTSTGRKTSERGNALVEFALVLPLLLLVFAGIVDFGFLFQRYEVLTNAAREGARVAVLPGYGFNAVQNRVREYLAAGLGSVPADLTVTAVPNRITPEPDPDTGVTPPPYRVMQVQASFSSQYVILGPIVSLFSDAPWGSEITLTATTIMRTEAQ